ncbi:Methyltransferase [Azospirillaceae bacterium]
MLNMLPMRRLLYCGDNLEIIRNYLEDQSVDLIYLDPPFNSNSTYHFNAPGATAATSKIAKVFSDHWRWDVKTEEKFLEIASSASTLKVGRTLSLLRELIGNDHHLSYLLYLALRLMEFHRVLKMGGSLYLHCDPNTSHYLKIILDSIFGLRNYRGEINWRRAGAHSNGRQGRRQYEQVRDVLLFYTRGDGWTWSGQFTPYEERYIANYYRQIEPETGRRYRMDNLTAARSGGDTLYDWPVKRSEETNQWEADLDDEWRAPKPGWTYQNARPYRSRFWAYSRERMTEFERQGRLVYSRSGMPSYKRYLDEMPGVPLQNDWQDISPVRGNQHLGFPTQKPFDLLERIVLSSSQEGDVILDPFCGSGTTLHVAEKLSRQWIGIDKSPLAIECVARRLRGVFPFVTWSVIDVTKIEQKSERDSEEEN